MSREVPGSTAEDLPEIVAAKVPGPSFVRPGAGEDAGIGRRRVDFEHVERQGDAFERRDPRGPAEGAPFHDSALHPTPDRPQAAVTVPAGAEPPMPHDR